MALPSSSNLRIQVTISRPTEDSLFSVAAAPRVVGSQWRS